MAMSVRPQNTDEVMINLAPERAEGPIVTFSTILIGAVSTAIVAWLTRPALASDDAAISFRYAERLATGHGLTYNDGEHVLGASSPLHTALLAVIRATGVSTPTAALALGIVGMGACGALVTHLGLRLGGRWAAVIALGLFIASPVRFHAAAGLESATLVGFGLAAVSARLAGRNVPPG